MIITALLTIIFNLFKLLTTPINIPALPDSVDVLMGEYMSYINAGLSILAAYTDLTYLLVLFGIVIAVDVGFMVFDLVVFCLKKIPFININ